MEIGTRRYPDRYFPVNLNLFNLFWHFGQLKLFRHERLTPKELSIARVLVVVNLKNVRSFEPVIHGFLGC